MSSLDPTTRLAGILRAQITALQGGTTGDRSVRNKRPKSPAEPTPGDFQAAASVIQQVRSIPPDHPDRKRRAFRLFLQAVLASQFGASVLDDPQFAVMLDHVDQKFRSDAALSKAADEAARILLNAADGDASL